jgi:hypothetical protein
MMRRYRVVVEVKMPNDASADDALSWMTRMLDTEKAERDLKDIRPHRIVSATPVREETF